MLLLPARPSGTFIPQRPAKCQCSGEQDPPADTNQFTDTQTCSVQGRGERPGETRPRPARLLLLSPGPGQGQLGELTNCLATYGVIVEQARGAPQLCSAVAVCNAMKSSECQHLVWPDSLWAVLNNECRLFMWPDSAVTVPPSARSIVRFCSPGVNLQNRSSAISRIIRDPVPQAPTSQWLIRHYNLLRCEQRARLRGSNHWPAQSAARLSGYNI